VKTCFKCNRELPYSEFYRHEMMADGHLGKCKDCTRDDVTEHRIKNIGRIREYDRRRSKEPHRAELRDRVGRKWRQAHPARARAHRRLRYAVMTGAVVRAEACQRCGGTPQRIEAHHWDYSKPLDVEWLCKPCHAQADKERRAA
jgi:hypothetical protein